MLSSRKSSKHGRNEPRKTIISPFTGLRKVSGSSIVVIVIYNTMILVVDKLTKSYNVNFGARSVINEVTRTAVMQIADAQIKGVLEKKSVFDTSFQR